MPKKTFTPEEVVGRLRQIEVLVSQGKTVPVACREWVCFHGSLSAAPRRLNELNRAG